MYRSMPQCGPGAIHWHCDYTLACDFRRCKIRSSLMLPAVYSRTPWCGPRATHRCCAYQPCNASCGVGRLGVDPVRCDYQPVRSDHNLPCQLCTVGRLGVGPVPLTGVVLASHASKITSSWTKPAKKYGSTPWCGPHATHRR